jgi:Tfp pilus assembly protein PilF
MAWSTMLLRAVAVGVVVSLAACATSTPPPSEPAPAPKPPATIVRPPPVQKPAPTPPRPATPSASAAWRPLVEKAEQAADRGDYEQALALLERAQRIDPDSSEVYLAMARTHAAKGDAAQARATAERGLLYCATEAECNALRAFTRR